MVSTENLSIRKIIVLYIAIAILIFGAFKTYEYLTTGKIVVTTNNSSNYIKVSQVVSGGSKPLSKQAQGKLSVRFKPGSYNVTVYSKSLQQGTKQSVLVKARRTVKLHLDPPKSLSVLPVYGSGVSGIVANKTDLYYIDRSTNKLMHDNVSGLTTMFPGYNFSNADWSSPGHGVLQDTRSNLYVVSGSSISPLDLPFRASPANNNAFSVSSDGTIYVSNSGNVYAGHAGSTFNKIYSSDSNSLGLSAGIGRVAVVITKGQGSVGSLVIVSASGKSINKNVSASQAVWSPDGRRLLVNGEGANYIFDDSLNSIGSIPVGNLGPTVWKNSHEVFYGLANQLWLYSVDTTKAQQVASLPTGVGIASMYLDSGASYLYFSTANHSSGQLYRASLGGRSGSKPLDTLSLIAPSNVGSCSLNYIAFARPTILISYPNLETTSALCIGAVKGSLRYYGLNPEKFQYITTPVASSGQ